MCTPIFIAALFTIAKIYKQPKCHTMGYYSAIKKEWNLAIVTTWMDLVGIMFSEISQTEKDK